MTVLQVVAMGLALMALTPSHATAVKVLRISQDNTVWTLMNVMQVITQIQQTDSYSRVQSSQVPL